MAKNEEIIIDIEINSQKAKERANELNKVLLDQKRRMSELNAEIKAVQKAYSNGEISAKQYGDELSRLSAEQNQLSGEIKETSSELKRENAAAKATAGSLAELRAENAALRDTMESLNLTTEEGQAQFAALSAKIKENTEKINAAEEATGNFRGSVGNYKGAIMEALNSQSLLTDQLGQTVAFLGQMSGQIATVVRSINTLKGAIAATGVGALVLALGALIAFFKNTTAGNEQFAKAMAGLGNIVNKVTGDIAKLGGMIADVVANFSKDPKKALEDFGNAIKENIESRFRGAMDIVKNSGETLAAVFRGDFSSAAESARKTLDSGIQAATGFENATEKLSNALSEYSKEVTDAYTEGEKFAQAQINAAKATRALEIQVAKLTGEFNILTQTADDDTKGFDERRKAAEKSFEVSIRLGQAEVNLAKTKLAVINQEIAMRKAQGLQVNDLLDGQTQAIVALENAESNVAQRRAERDEAFRKMRRDELETTLDLLIDSADANKASLERQVADTRGGVENRLRFLEELRNGTIKTQKDLDFFQKRIDATAADTFEERKQKALQAQEIFQNATNQFIVEIEKYTGKAINAEDLLAEKDIVAQERKVKALQLDEITQTRLLEFLRERTAAEQDYVDMQTQLIDEQIDNEQRLVQEKIAADAKLADEQMRAQEMRAQRLSNDYAAQMALLQAQMQKELEAVQYSEELKYEVTQKYANMMSELQKNQLQGELNAYGQFFGQLAGLFEEQSEIGKAFAIGETIVNTIQASMAAYTAMAKYDPVFLAPAAAAVAAATGAKAVAKIAGVKFADGGFVSGPSHAQGGIKFQMPSGQLAEMEGGEFITNKVAAGNNSDALQKINAFGRTTQFDVVPKFAAGGFVSPATQQNINITNSLGNLPAPILRVTDLNRVQKTVEVTDALSSL